MWNIVTDSSCDCLDFGCDGSEIRCARVPFFLRTDTKEYTDDGTIDIPGLIRTMKESRICTTACPTPAAWHAHFSRPGDILAFTISSNLSGSYQSACAARAMIREEEPDKKIAIINTRADGPTLTILIRAAIRLIRQGLSFENIVEKMNELNPKINIIYALSSFDNLVKNGRMSRLTGFVANTLGFWGIGIASDEGTIRIMGKVRGTGKVLNFILNDLKEKACAVQEVVIAHCLNPSMAEALREKIRETFGNIPVDVMPCGGLDSFYAEKNGLIVSYLCEKDVRHLPGPSADM